MVRQANSINMAFIPATISIALRKSARSALDAAVGGGILTKLLDEVFDHYRVDDTGEAAATDDYSHGGSSSFEEPMSRYGGCWRIEQGSRQTERRVRQEEMPIFRAESDSDE